MTGYLTSADFYAAKVSSDIMYNEPRHVVSVFKEYLIFDDLSEYLYGFYGGSKGSGSTAHQYLR